MRKKNLPKPTSQIQEVLYELIQRFSIDRRGMMFHCGVYNLTAQISELRLIHRVKIYPEEITRINKYSRKVKYVRYKLKDKNQAIQIYLQMIENSK